MSLDGGFLKTNNNEGISYLQSKDKYDEILLARWESMLDKTEPRTNQQNGHKKKDTATNVNNVISDGPSFGFYTINHNIVVIDSMEKERERFRGNQY